MDDSVNFQMGASELHSVAGNITRVVAFMIEKSPELFARLPEDLVRDIAHYWQQMEEISDPSRLSRSKSEDDLDSSNSSLPHVSVINLGFQLASSELRSTCIIFAILN